MRATRINEVEIPGGIFLEARHKIVSTGRSVDEIAEVFVKVSLAITVQVVQSRDLVTAEHEDLPVPHFETERLKKPGRVTFPVQLGQFGIDPSDAPDVPMNAAHVSSAVRGEVHTGQKHQRFPWVLVRNGESIDRENLCIESALAKGLQ